MTTEKNQSPKKVQGEELTSEELGLITTMRNLIITKDGDGVTAEIRGIDEDQILVVFKTPHLKREDKILINRKTLQWEM